MRMKMVHADPFHSNRKLYILFNIFKRKKYHYIKILCCNFEIIRFQFRFFQKIDLKLFLFRGNEIVI